MAVPTATVEQQHQQIKDMDLHEPMVFSPKYVRRWFVSNVFLRVFAHLFGYDGSVVRRVKTDSAGRLETVSSGTSLTANDAFSGTAADAFGANIGPGTDHKVVEIWTRTFDMVLSRKVAGGAFQDDIILEAGSYYYIEATTAAVRVKNNVVGSNATYRIQYWN